MEKQWGAMPGTPRLELGRGCVSCPDNSFAGALRNLLNRTILQNKFWRKIRTNNYGNHNNCQDNDDDDDNDDKFEDLCNVEILFGRQCLL